MYKDKIQYTSTLCMFHQLYYSLELFTYF